MSAARWRQGFRRVGAPPPNRKSRSAVDKVVLRLQVRTKLPLIEANAFGEIERTRILVIGLPWVLHWIYGGAHFVLDFGLVFLELSFRSNKRSLD
jgi:hypothetical protein